jgi:hypothetical protein
MALLAAALLCALAAAPFAEAKRGKAGGKVDFTETVGAAIPDGSPGLSNGPDGVLVSTITVGRKFKGRRIRDVNVTVHTTGSPATDYPLDFFDLRFLLIAPNGAGTLLFEWISGGTIGPLTIDDESTMTLGGQFASDPFQLVDPFVGTARAGTLATMDNGPANGVWRLVAIDQFANPPATSVLEFWRLRVLTGKPYRTIQRGRG